MENNKSKSIEITFDLSDYPDTSKLMQELRKLGYDQGSVEVNMPKVKFKGQFTGSIDDLISVMSKILEKIEKEDN